MYGGRACDPLANAWETLKYGLTLKALVRSALRPENIELVRKTSRCTSFAILSTDPGFDNPNAALRSEKDVYVSARAAETALLYRNPRGASFSSAIVDMMV